MRIFLLLLMLLSPSARGAGFVAGQFLHIDSEVGVGVPSVQTQVYSLPDMRLIARGNDSGSTATVSTDGKRLYVLDAHRRRVATYELPMLRQIREVDLQAGLPFFDESSWLREHPTRPDVLMLLGSYWLDARTGALLETPASIGVPEPGAYLSLISISHSGHTLLVADGNRSAGIAPYFKAINLDDPRQVQSGHLDQAGDVYIEGRGMIGFRGEENEERLSVSEFGTNVEIASIPLPAGLIGDSNLAPFSISEIILFARTADSAHQVILLLDLNTRRFTELHRLPRVWPAISFGYINVRGRQLLLSAPSDYIIFPGPAPNVTPAQVLFIDVDTGQVQQRYWAPGGGPISRGNLLATGSLQSVPALDRSSATAAALLFVMLGIFASAGIGYRKRMQN